MRKLFEIRPSEIEGNGVFALKKISKDQTIWFLNGEICSLEKIIKRVIDGTERPSDPLQIADELYLDLDDFSKTFNHSCEPNAFVRGKNELVALRDIKLGEEIIYDYSTTMNDNEVKIQKAGLSLWTCKCHCGSKNCRKTINQFRTLPKKVQLFYTQKRLMPDFMLKHFK